MQYGRRKARRESTLEARAVKWARSNGIVVAKLKECSGMPDRIFFTPNKPLIIEFKKHGEKPEELQSWYLTTLMKAGYKVGWCDTWEGFIEAMRKAGVK